MEVSIFHLLTQRRLCIPKLVLPLQLAASPVQESVREGSPIRIKSFHCDPTRRIAIGVSKGDITIGWWKEMRIAKGGKFFLTRNNCFSGRPESTFLRKANRNVLSFGECKKTYPQWFNTRMICVNSPKVDACQGDGGAPLMRKYNGRYYLAGVTSWKSTKGCRVVGKPRIFSAVHSSLTWISSRTKLDVA
ncbi:chymotrypsin B [Nephila pilipes]|uniref:Chymotrypsin B n=1 Tax=Nephila pilipes TaxID=299642 RepID=A0A8X6QKA1_NEPPI|nr:chymotrypsin B [Nephila pilipes]